MTTAGRLRRPTWHKKSQILTQSRKRMCAQGNVKSLPDTQRSLILLMVNICEWNYLKYELILKLILLYYAFEWQLRFGDHITVMFL